MPGEQAPDTDLEGGVMGRPRAGYFLKDGKRVPGVTTIIGRFKESGGLIHWAWQCGVDGINYRDARDKAANSGTLAHDMIELFLLGKDPDDAIMDHPKEIMEKAWKGFAAFKIWAKQTKMEVIETEMPLVSETYRFGGCSDALIMVNGKLSIGDWKTGNKLYPDMLIQLAAYKQLWEENHPEDKIEGFDMMRFSKEEADFVHAHFDQLDDAWKQFLLFREAYDLDKKLKKRI